VDGFAAGAAVSDLAVESLVVDFDSDVDDALEDSLPDFPFWE
jgi:hypothetical protein